MIIVTGTVHADTEHVDDLLALCVDHVRRSRAEPGCISHTVHRDVEDPLRVFFYEEWDDLDALRDHFGVPASGSFVDALTGLAATPPSIAIYASEPTRV